MLNDIMIQVFVYSPVFPMILLFVVRIRVTKNHSSFDLMFTSQSVVFLLLGFIKPVQHVNLNIFFFLLLQNVLPALNNKKAS